MLRRRLVDAGAVVYQQCPPLQLDAATPAVRPWCEAHAVLAVEDLRGEVVAVAFVFPGDDPEEILTEAMLPDHPQARDAVASCMAATLGGAAGPVRLDGHVGDPHFALWDTVPGVHAGETDPLDLLEIRPGMLEA